MCGFANPIFITAEVLLTKFEGYLIMGGEPFDFPVIKQAVRYHIEKYSGNYFLFSREYVAGYYNKSVTQKDRDMYYVFG